MENIKPAPAAVSRYLRAAAELADGDPPNDERDAFERISRFLLGTPGHGDVRAAAVDEVRNVWSGWPLGVKGVLVAAAREVDRKAST